MADGKQFDVVAAKAAGYSDAEIQAFLRANPMLRSAAPVTPEAMGVESPQQMGQRQLKQNVKQFETEQMRQGRYVSRELEQEMGPPHDDPMPEDALDAAAVLSLVINPVATLRTLAGGALGAAGGGWAGREAVRNTPLRHVMKPETGGDIGAIAGGLYGGYRGARGLPSGAPLSRFGLLGRVLGGGAEGAEGLPSGRAALGERIAAERGMERLVRTPEELAAEAQRGRAMEAATQGAKPQARLAGMVRAGRGEIPQVTNEELMQLRRTGGLPQPPGPGLGPGAAHESDPAFTLAKRVRDARSVYGGETEATASNAIDRANKSTIVKGLAKAKLMTDPLRDIGSDIQPEMMPPGPVGRYPTGPQSELDILRNPGPSQSEQQAAQSGLSQWRSDLPTSLWGKIMDAARKMGTEPPY